MLAMTTLVVARSGGVGCCCGVLWWRVVGGGRSLCGAWGADRFLGVCEVVASVLRPGGRGGRKEGCDGCSVVAVRYGGGGCGGVGWVGGWWGVGGRHAGVGVHPDGGGAAGGFRGDRLGSVVLVGDGGACADVCLFGCWW